MAQDDWQIVAAHLGILKAGGTILFLDTALPDALVTHLLEDARPVVVLTRGQDDFRGLPTLDVLALPETKRRSAPPAWLDDPRERLASPLLHERNHRAAQGRRVPARRLREPRALLRGLLRSRSGPGRHLAHVVPGLRRQHVRDVQRLGVGLRGGAADEGADPVRPGSRPRPPRGRGHRALLPAGAADHPHVDPRARSPLPASAATSFLRAKPSPPRSSSGGPVRDGRSSTPTAPPKRAPTRADRACGRGSPSPSAPRFPTSPTSSSRSASSAPLPHGEDGELCIGGVHLARGYRNLPEETAGSSSPTLASAVSTAPGTAAGSTSATQRVQFLGRIDAQLKVRGHRVEVQPVEDLLQTQFAEIEAAVLDYQNQELVAFVTAPSVRDAEIPVVAPAPAEWAARVRESLARQLPAPSVPTRIFLVEQFVAEPGLREDRPQAPARSLSAASRRRCAGGSEPGSRTGARRGGRSRRAAGLRARGPGDLPGGHRPRAGMGRRLRRPRRTFDPDRAADGAPAGRRAGRRPSGICSATATRRGGWPLSRGSFRRPPSSPRRRRDPTASAPSASKQRPRCSPRGTSPPSRCCSSCCSTRLP